MSWREPLVEGAECSAEDGAVAKRDAFVIFLSSSFFVCSGAGSANVSSFLVPTSGISVSAFSSPSPRLTRNGLSRYPAGDSGGGGGREGAGARSDSASNVSPFISASSVFGDFFEDFITRVFAFAGVLSGDTWSDSRGALRGVCAGDVFAEVLAFTRGVDDSPASFREGVPACDFP